MHQDGALWIKRDTGASPAFRSESSFIVRPGLAGAAGAVSLESSAAPGAYLRHADFVLHVHRNDGSRLFREDATFMPAGGASGYLQQYAAAMGPSTADASGAAVLIAPAPGAGPGTSASPLAALAAELGMPTLSWSDIGSPLGSGGGDGSRPLFGAYSGYKVVARTAHALRQARTFSLDHPHVDRPVAAVVEGGRELLVFWRMASNMRRLYMRAQRRRHGEARKTSLGRASGVSSGASGRGSSNLNRPAMLSEGQLAERFSLLYKACHALAYAHGSPVGAVPHGSLCPAAVLVHDLATGDATSVRLAPFDFPARCPAPDAPPATLRRPRGTYSCMDPMLLLRLPGGAAAAEKVKVAADSANLAAASAASAALAAAGGAAAGAAGGAGGAAAQATAAAAVPTSSDVYSLGCIIWAVLTGEEPYSLAASVAAKRRASRASSAAALAAGGAAAAAGASAEDGDGNQKRKGNGSGSGSDSGSGSEDSDGSMHSSSTSSSGSSSSTTSCSSDDGSDSDGDDGHDDAAAAGGAGAAHAREHELARQRRRRIAARRAYTPPLEPHTAGLRRLRRAVQLGSPDPGFALLRQSVPAKYVDFLAPWLAVMWAWEPTHRPSAVDVAGLLSALVAQAQAAAAAEAAAADEAAAATATATATAAADEQPSLAQPSLAEPHPETKEQRPSEPAALPAPQAADAEPSVAPPAADDVIAKAAAPSEALSLAPAPAADDVESDNDEDDEEEDEDPTGLAGSSSSTAAGSAGAGAATGLADTPAVADAAGASAAATASSLARRQSVAPGGAARRGSGLDATAAAAAADDDLRARGRGVLDVRVGLLHSADWAAPFVAGYAQLGTSSRRAAGGGAGAGSAAGAAAAAAAAEELLLELFRRRDDAKAGLPPFGIVRPCEYALMRGEPEERKKKRAAAAAAAAAGTAGGAGDDGGPGDETLCFHLRPLPLPVAIIGFALPKRIIEVRAHSVGMRNRWWERFKAAGFASAEQYRELAREPTLLAIASGRTLPNGAPCDTPAARAAARTAAGRILEDDHPVFAGPPKRARQKEGAGPTWF